jgi:hypothetical protein
VQRCCAIAAIDCYYWFWVLGSPDSRARIRELGNWQLAIGQFLQSKRVKGKGLTAPPPLPPGSAGNER